MSPTSGVPAVLPLLLIGAGAVLMAVGALLLLQRLRQDSHRVAVTGVVTGHREDNGRSHPVVGFTTAQGREVTATLPTPAPTVRPDGSRVALRYDPDRPEDVVRAGLVVDAGLLRGPVVEGVGVLLLAAGVLLR